MDESKSHAAALAPHDPVRLRAGCPSTSWQEAPSASVPGAGTLPSAAPQRPLEYTSSNSGPKNTQAPSGEMNLTKRIFKKADANASTGLGVRAGLASGVSQSQEQVRLKVRHSHSSLRSITPPRNSTTLISQPPMRI